MDGFLSQVSIDNGLIENLGFTFLGARNLSEYVLLFGV